MSTYGFTISVENKEALAAMKQIESQLAGMGVKVKTETEKVSNSFQQMGAKIKNVFNEYKGLITGGLAVGGIWGGIEFVKGSIEAFDKFEKAIKKVDAVVQSTKGVAGFTTGDIEEQAKNISKGIVNSKSDILDAQGMLLSFTGIKGPIFGEATKAVADFATFYKEDMTSAALSIGKALNDPAKGMNRLQRQGVAFTEQQKEQIKNYQQQGKLAEAQSVILKELQTEFGGQAAAFAMTDEGKLMMAKKQWADLKITIGEVFSKIQVSLIPAFNKMVSYIKMAFNSGPLQFFLHHIKDLVSVVVKLIPAFVIYKTLMGSIALITEVAKLKNLDFVSSLFSVKAAEEGATVAANGLKIGLLETGVGAFAIALGYVISKLIDMNAKMEESIEKIGQIKQLTQKSDEFSRSNQENNPYLKGFGNLSTSGQINAYNKAKSLVEEIPNQNIALEQSVKAYKNQLKLNENPAYFANHHNDASFIHNDKLRELITSLTNQIGNNNNILKANKGNIGIIESYFKQHKIDPNSITGNNAITENGLKTSALSGASGGLGEAKVINIHIDTVQKIMGITTKELKQKGMESAEYIIRALNNVSENQAGVQ